MVHRALNLAELCPLFPVRSAERFPSAAADVLDASDGTSVTAGVTSGGHAERRAPGAGSMAATGLILLLVVIAVVLVTFAALDVREVAHQLDVVSP